MSVHWLTNLDLSGEGAAVNTRSVHAAPARSRETLLRDGTILAMAHHPSATFDPSAAGRLSRAVSPASSSTLDRKAASVTSPLDSTRPDVWRRLDVVADDLRALGRDRRAVALVDRLLFLMTARRTRRLDRHHPEWR